MEEFHRLLHRTCAAPKLNTLESSSNSFKVSNRIFHRGNDTSEIFQMTTFHFHQETNILMVFSLDES